MKMSKYKAFAQALLNWHKSHARTFPWKEDKDPYKIWVSEIILQQTRVAQGLPYYQKFIESYPTIQSLAETDEEVLLKVWEGLGYYSRARNMLTTAQYIVEELDATFPSTYEDLLALKGIGPYTAAAIASFAFGLRYPVIDGNVLRVISRIWGIQESIDINTTKKVIQAHAEHAILEVDPASFNQAIMDFGATQCTPGVPECMSCDINKICQAYQNNEVSKIPNRTKKVKNTNRVFHFGEIRIGKKILLRKRTKKDIWKGLYELPYKELSKENKNTSLLECLKDDVYFPKGLLEDPMGEKRFKQKLSHQTIDGIFKKYECEEIEIIDKNRYQLVDRSLVHTFAVPKIIDWYLRDNSITLF